MSVTALWFGQAGLRLFGGEVDFLTDTLRVMLCTSSYTPDQDDHLYLSAADWASGAYVLEDRVRPTTRNGHLYECTVAGTSDVSEPVWPTVDGDTVVDGTVTWTCIANGDISYYEVTDTGYTAEGEALASKTLSYSTLVTTFDAADVTWASSSITARYAVLYQDSGTESTSILLAYVDFGEDKVSSSGDFKVIWHANGILTVTAE